MKRTDLALLTLSLGLVLAWSYGQPVNAEAEEGGGGNWGCFLCDDFYDEGEEMMMHTDQPMFQFNDKKGTRHDGKTPFSCGFHLNY